ncbi:hypothetical protein CR513_42800, partial [Mucuna pruriens]
MEQAIDELKQQSMQTRAEVGQIKEHMGEMREQLNKNAFAEAQVVEEPEAVEASRPVPQATQVTVSLPHYSYPLGHPRQIEATFKDLEATPIRDEKISSLEQRVRIIEGTGGHDLDAADLCLMSDVALPADFKTPKFEKYKGSSCPRVHLAMYCRKMAAYVHQDKILVHCFQHSLTGAALNWYVNTEKRTSKDLEGSS